MIKCRSFKSGVSTRVVGGVLTPFLTEVTLPLVLDIGRRLFASNKSPVPGYERAHKLGCQIFEGFFLAYKSAKYNMFKRGIFVFLVGDTV